MERNYSKALTVILVIVIVVILGILGFLGYQALNGSDTKKDGQESVEEFKEDRKAQNKTKDDVKMTQLDLNLVDSNTVQPTPTPTPEGLPQYKGYDMIGTIEIPKTKANYPILLTTSAPAMKVSVTLLYPVNDPYCLNKIGNVVISGHNYRDGTFFSDNDKLTEGDKFYITDLSGARLTYRIVDKQTLSPEEFSYAASDPEGKCVVYLSTCTDDVKNRIVIKGVAE